jgi:hypothetical protein
MSYTVKDGYNIKLLGDIERNTKDITLSGGEQFVVKEYTGYDVYGEDRVEYCGNLYILIWNNKTLEALANSIHTL